MAKHTDKTAAEAMAEDTAQGQPAKRTHKATYARDKMKGGWLVRVMGPHANRFAGRVVPVTRMDDSEEPETLDALLWSGQDKETGKPVALYSFQPKPKGEAEDELPF